MRVLKAEAGEPAESAPQFAPMRIYPGMKERPRELAALAAANGKPVKVAK